MVKYKDIRQGKTEKYWRIAFEGKNIIIPDALLVRIVSLLRKAFKK